MPASRDAAKHKARLSRLFAALRQGDKTAQRRIANELKMHRAQVRPQGKTARGSTEAIGRRGKIGKPGKKGAKTVKLQNIVLLDRIVVHFDDVYRQLNEQLRLIAKIQQQVDGLVATVGRLSAPFSDGR